LRWKLIMASFSHLSNQKSRGTIRCAYLLAHGAVASCRTYSRSHLSHLA
jgi:hypothetical protein